MNPTTKQILKSVLIATAEKMGMVIATALVSHGLLAPAQVAGFDQIFVGLVVGALTMAWAWYRAHGRALIAAELAQFQAQMNEQKNSTTSK